MTASTSGASLPGLRAFAEQQVAETDWPHTMLVSAQEVIDALDAAAAAARAEERARIIAEGIAVHVNDGSGEASAMAWSQGHTAGYEEGAAAAAREPLPHRARVAQLVHERDAARAEADRLRAIAAEALSGWRGLDWVVDQEWRRDSDPPCEYEATIDRLEAELAALDAGGAS